MQQSAMDLFECHVCPEEGSGCEEILLKITCQLVTQHVLQGVAGASFVGL